MKVRDSSADAVKGFAILLVMLGHCIVLNNMQDGYLYDGIKAVQMPLFMAVSGYLCAPLRIESLRELSRRLCRRAVSCLVPFVSWIFVTNVTSFPEKLLSVLFALDTGLWFLVTLFLLSAALYTAIYAGQATPLGGAGFWGVTALAAGAAAFHYLSGSTFLGPDLTVNYFPFFFGGYLAGRALAERGNRKTGGQSGGTAVIGTLLAAQTVLFLFLIIKYDMIYAANRGEWLLQLTASASGTIVCFYGIYHLREGKGKRMLSFLGKYTLEIYVLHFRFARVLGIGDAGLKLWSLKGAGAVLLTFLIMSALTAFFIYTLKTLRITDFLLFGKVYPSHSRIRN